MFGSENQFHIAEEFFNEKKYLHALQIYQTLLNVPEFKRKAVIRLIEIYELQNQFEKAVKTFEEFLDEEDNDENMRMYFAQFLFRYEKYHEANQILSGISVSGRPEKNFLLGLSNYYLEEYDIAVINFNDFILQKGSSELAPEAHLYLGKCFFEKADLESALIHLKKSEVLNKQDYRLYYSLAQVYYLKEMYYHAIECIQKSIKLNPLETNSIKLSGKIFYKLGEFQKAKNDLKYLVSTGNTDSDIFAILGTICANLNDFNSANSYFKDALKIDPSNEAAKKGLLECKSKTK